LTQPSAFAAGALSGETKDANLRELKRYAYDLRVVLRAAVAKKEIKHAPKSAWEWPKSSPELKKVRELLKK
jgi:hypothetical protein